MNALRSLKRNVAKTNMKKAGMRQICKKHKTGSSSFEPYWRDYLPKKGG